MRDKRWTGFGLAAFVVSLNAFFVIQITGVAYEPFSWKAFAQNGYPIGEGCTLPGECSSTFCVDGVCCEEACNLPGQNCAVPGAEGTCQFIAAPAPAMSPLGLAIAFFLLAAIGGWTIVRRRSES